MPSLSGIYDSNPIQPVAKIKENLSIWTLGAWVHYRIEYQEPIAPGPASTVEAIVASGATTLAANATIARRVVTILQLNELELLQVRWEPLDNVEGLIYEQSGQQKFASRNIHSRVDRNTRNWDPFLASTTFFILGRDRDMNLEVRNPMGYAIPAARFIFWGYRMVIKEHDSSTLSSAVKDKLRQGDLDVVRQVIGATTWIPAEGRSG